MFIPNGGPGFFSQLEGLVVVGFKLGSVMWSRCLPFYSFGVVGALAGSKQTEKGAIRIFGKHELAPIPHPTPVSE